MGRDYCRVNFLGPIFGLDSGVFESFHVPRDHIKYINVASSYPPSIVQRSAKNISTRITRLSANIKFFESHTALVKAVYREKIQYIQEACLHNTGNSSNSSTPPTIKVCKIRQRIKVRKDSSGQ